MSTYNSTAIPGYIDDDTKAIVCGYIRDLQKILYDSKSEISSLNVNSDEISIITLLYLDDHFMLYRGSYQWKISDPITINNILSAQQTQKFTSSPFEIAKLKWMIVIYPNGNTNAASSLNQFLVFIHLLSMPSSWNQFIVCQTIKIPQLDTQYSMCHSYTKMRNGNNKSWPNDTLSFNELINQTPSINELSIIVQIKIIRIVAMEKYKKVIKYQSDVNKYSQNFTLNKPYKFKWNLNPSHLCRLHTHFLNKKPISSRIMGDMFNISYTPNQNQFKLRLLSLPNKDKIDGVQVKWTIYIQELPDIKCASISLLTFKSHSTTNTTSTLLIPSLDVITGNNIATNSDKQEHIASKDLTSGFL